MTEDELVHGAVVARLIEVVVRCHGRIQRGPNIRVWAVSSSEAVQQSWVVELLWNGQGLPRAR